MTVSAPDGRRAQGELVLAALFLRPTPERLEALLRAARGVSDWSPIPLLLESHGFLGLALRNLDLAGVEVPPSVRRTLEGRATAMREIELAFRVTLELLLAETGRDGIDVTLLKGASLCLDLYTGRGWRSQGDLDLLVAPEQVLRAVRAAERAGLFLSDETLPIWWYRLTHFHLKLQPGAAPLREVELHWALESRAELRTLRLRELLARRRPVELGSLGSTHVFTLDATDRLLHLVTHLASHFGHAPGRADRAYLLAAAATPGHPLRLKWLLDLRSEVERLHGSLAPADLVERARRWNAQDELAWALAWVRSAMGLVPETDPWAQRVLALLPAGAGTRIESGSHPWPIEERPVAGLDFRLAALRSFPRWLFPPRSYFEHRGGRAPVALQRLAHVLGVLGLALLALFALPLAALARLLARASRRRARRSALDPERVLERTLAARACARRSEGTNRSAAPEPMLRDAP